jgi:exopolysaccharide production protein ExoY
LPSLLNSAKGADSTFRVLSITPRWRPSDAFERLFAAALALGSLPILCVAALAVWMLSGREPFVAHRRLGLRGKPVWVWKLRTMWKGRVRRRFRLIEYLGDQPAELPKHKADPRITSRFASICRRYSIDELPQLCQVIGGELALVGPRPLTAGEMKSHYAEAAAEVLMAKPGLTGLWQIKGRGRLTYCQRRRLDLFLVRKFSPGLYAYVLLSTPLRVLSGNGAW